MIKRVLKSKLYKSLNKSMNVKNDQINSYEVHTTNNKLH